MRSYYLKVLGLGENATLSDIKSAYRKLARLYHPDVSKHANANAKFIAVNEAYKYLISPQKTKPRPQVWQQPPANTRKPKPKSEVEMRREKMRERLQKEKEAEEAEAREDARLRRLPLKEFMQSDYFKNTLAIIRSWTRSYLLWFWALIWVTLSILALVSGAYISGTLMLLAPILFVLYALFSRP